MKYFNTGVLFFFLSMVLWQSCTRGISTVADDQPRRIELLFLGHTSEHHHSNAYFPVLAAGLTKEGINLSYTEDPSYLNKETLDQYDGLIIYANHDSITPEQNNALLDFVSGGKAFIPIHSASFCFRNSSEYIALVGGQFKSHETGNFTATIIDKSHPIMQNVQEFSTWDETYVHWQLADDITVLMERVEGDHREPWTWVKEYGKGKVFYTAYGHDMRTWSQPTFHQLVKEGILWAVEPHVKENRNRFMADMPTLVYEDRDNIPNYERRDPKPQYQLPLSPQESAKFLQVPVGFEVELFASEPDIINPIAMDWDERGRLWVIETIDYPNTVRQDNGVGDDRIKILEDTDGDGKADKVTIFAENLNIPTSFTFANGGIIVSQAPHFLFLKDTDGDDVADVRQILIDGWGTFDTHAGPSNLQRGIDNKIYGVLGYSGFKGEIFGKPHEFRQGVYRFDQGYKDFEFVTSTSNNTWGLGITETNEIFASTANNTHCVFVGIPNRYYTRVTGIPAQGSVKIDGHYDMKSITPNVRQVDVFGGFTAAAGHHFYTARSFPRKYWNRIAFVCEPTGGLVHNNIIESSGAGYTERDGGNLIASADEWFSPVEAKVGPEGNVWVLDWYNFIIQHNPTPTSARGGYDAVNGEGNAYINPLRDRSRGRVWVVKPKGSKQKTYQLNADKPDQWVEALNHENKFWRSTAQRMLVDKADKSVLPKLYALVKNAPRDQAGLYPAALHALWTIEGLGAIGTDPKADEVVRNALVHSSPSIRRAALQLVPKNAESDALVLKYKLIQDTDPTVQMAAMLYLSQREPSEEIGKIIYQLSLKSEVKRDPWLSRALYIAATRHHVGFLAEMIAADGVTSSEVSMVGKDWEKENYNDAEWKTMRLPQYFESAGLQIDGIVWFRKKLNLSSVDASANATISLGPVDDEDIVYINGVKIGSTNGYDKMRVYSIPRGVLKSGQNTIAIRVKDTGGGGGLYGVKDMLFLDVGTKKIPLHGDWVYAVQEDFGKKLTNVFDGTSLAEVLYANYGEQVSHLVAAAEDAKKPDQIVKIKTIQNEMKFDLSSFTVTAGSKVELVFENNDFMQHNLLILKRGTAERVGAAADRMAMDPKSADKDYIPDMPEVLFHVPIVDPDDFYKLRFTVPDEPGDYPYICTFPGHWQIMQGVMKVVAATM